MPPRYNRVLRDQVGQLLIMGFEGTEFTADLRTVLMTLRPGGIILFARNIVNARQTHELVRACQSCVRTPMFRCIDMEGGSVDRLKSAIAPAPSVAAIAATEDKKLFRAHGRLIGEEVRAIGFNTDFAPVLDLGFEASSTVLGSRTASTDPLGTISYARGFLRGLRDAKILGCGKHFPGLGEANLDTHKELPSVRKSWKALWREDLLPYRELRSEMPFVMVAHVEYPEVATGPASLSEKWMTRILRKKIGYRGLIISDDLEMGGVQAAASIEDAAVETLRAGADIFLVCHNEEHVWRTYQAVFRAAERDKRFRRRVEQAAQRVMTFKSKWRVSADVKKPPSEHKVEELRAALTGLHVSALQEQ